MFPLTEEQIATITGVLLRHQTTADGDCDCGRSKEVPIPNIGRMFTQQAHQAEVIARTLHLKALNLPELH